MLLTSIGDIEVAQEAKNKVAPRIRFSLMNLFMLKNLVFVLQLSLTCIYV